jgi:hypothetical protein
MGLFGFWVVCCLIFQLPELVVSVTLGDEQSPEIMYFIFDILFSNEVKQKGICAVCGVIGVLLISFISSL